MLARRVAFLYSLASIFSTSVLGLEPAWNGQILPGAVPDSSDPAPFLPYYVPPGSYAVDNTSPLVIYSSTFRHAICVNAVNGSYHVSNTSQSTAQLKFFGSTVEWFGELSPESGIASIYIDGTLQQAIDAYSPQLLKQQRLFGIYDLSLETHQITIVVTGQRNTRSLGDQITVDAFVISRTASSGLGKRDEAQTTFSPRGWDLVQKGQTGVSAMQLAIVTDTHAIILDKVEHNLLSINGHPAWGALYDLQTNTVRALNIRSNSFCAGGTWLSNGTLLSIGGNPVVESSTGAADFGDVNGLQAIRMFNPCDDGKCDVLETPNQIRMASARWYNSATRLDDGSVMIIGGSSKGGWINNETTNNPTIEYYPPKNLHGRNGLPITLPFLSDTLNANLFPLAFTLPDGRIFMAANRDAMIYDWRSNVEQRLPRIPNGVRVTYPMSGTGVLLPLSPANNYTPEIMLCGGSTIDDTRPGYDISSSEAASNQCSRMVLSPDGIDAGWNVETMPDARIMPDAIMLPNGQIVIVNGGGSGIAGYGNVKGQVGQSNAANPVFAPVLYDPSAALGKRFNSAAQTLPTSNIPRLYHSVATLTPNGTIMIAGSNPNLDRSDVEFRTEYRVEWLSPPYMNVQRPTFSKFDRPTSILFGKTFNLPVGQIPNSAKDVSVSLMDLGFVTHGVHMNARLVILACSLSTDRTSLMITGPPSGHIYPPGPAWLYVVVDGVPSIGRKVMVGDGQGPPIDEGAIKNMLANTQPDVSSKDAKKTSE